MAETRVAMLRRAFDKFHDVLANSAVPGFDGREYTRAKNRLFDEAGHNMPHLLAVVEAVEKAWPHMFEELRASSKVAKKRAYEKVYAALGPLFEELPDD